MPKFTYPIVFILNPETGLYNGYVPDLVLVAEGEKLEEVYAEVEELIEKYFKLAVRYNVDVPSPSSLETVIAKWPGYKVSLITANIPN